ncbi:hypothetical protein COO60DRAFT_442832 [Scenedesmus sp. NREL 46B-D3]|nr:hypothetical protein COO60DRAFT_442832 [Scenedesmus sp. NREL 46B-D3]
MSNGTLIEAAQQQQQPEQKRMLRARRGRSAAAGISSTSPSSPPDAPACVQQDTSRPLVITSTAAPEVKQPLTEQQQQQAQEGDAARQPDVEPASQDGKRQRKQRQGHGQAAAEPQPAMSAFEAERAVRIAANMARLAELELPQLAAGLAATQPAGKARGAGTAGPSQRGVGSSKRKRSDDQQQPVRRSARNKGEAPDPATAGGIDYETRDGSVVLLHGAAGPWGAAAARQQQKLRHHQGRYHFAAAMGMTKVTLPFWRCWPRRQQRCASSSCSPAAACLAALLMPVVRRARSSAAAVLLLGSSCLG